MVNDSGLTKIYINMIRIIENIKFFLKCSDRREKERSVDLVVLAAVYVHMFSRTYPFRILPGKYKSGYDHTDQDSQRQVMKYNGHDDDQDHDEYVGHRYFSEDLQACPFKSADSYHKHQ